MRRGVLAGRVRRLGDDVRRRHDPRGGRPRRRAGARGRGRAHAGPRPARAGSRRTCRCDPRRSRRAARSPSSRRPCARSARSRRGSRSRAPSGCRSARGPPRTGSPLSRASVVTRIASFSVLAAGISAPAFQDAACAVPRCAAQTPVVTPPRRSARAARGGSARSGRGGAARRPARRSGEAVHGADARAADHAAAPQRPQHDRVVADRQPDRPEREARAAAATLDPTPDAAVREHDERVRPARHRAVEDAGVRLVRERRLQDDCGHAGEPTAAGGRGAPARVARPLIG